MAKATVTDDNLVVTIQGIQARCDEERAHDPLADVRGATVDPGITTGWPGLKSIKDWPGVKVQGTDTYGRYLGGTFTQDGDRVFWDVASPERAIVITLDNEEFKRLNIEVDDPERTVREIEGVLARRS